MKLSKYLKIAAGLLALSAAPGANAAGDILNASYDVSRELFAQVNPAFVEYWKGKSGQTVEVKQSHGGSSKQARSIIEGLAADVVTFNQGTDIDVLHANGAWVAKNWREKFPDNSSPSYSFNGFLVRKGNPKGIRDWGDLAKPGVKVIFPNPKTSGNGRYSYLAALNWAKKHYGGDQEKLDEYLVKFLANVPVFDTGGRGATTTFVERNIGDVLITFESETNGIRKQYGGDKYEVVIPPESIRADFPVAVVDRVEDRRGTRELARAYLEFLYSPEGQDILARNYNRVRDAKVSQKYAAQFPRVELATVEEAFGGWDKAQKAHFDDGGTFDKLLALVAVNRNK